MTPQRATGALPFVVLGMALAFPTLAMAELPSDVSSVAQGFAAADQSSVASSCFRMVGALFFCLGAFAAGIHLYRRYMGKHGVAGRRRLIIRERVALTPKATLMVVSLDGKEFLVASGTEKVTLLPSHALSAAHFGDSLSEVCDEVEAFNA